MRSLRENNWLWQAQALTTAAATLLELAGGSRAVGFSSVATSGYAYLEPIIIYGKGVSSLPISPRAASEMALLHSR